MRKRARPDSDSGNPDLIMKMAEAFAFERTGGSPEEARAAEIIAGFLRKAGFSPKTESFKIKKAISMRARLFIGRRELPCSPYELTGSGDVGGDLVFIKNPEDPERDVRNRIVLLNGLMRGKFYKALKERGAKGFVCVRSPLGEIRGPIFSQEAYEKYGELPGVMVDYEVGIAIRAAGRVRLMKEERVSAVDSRNVLAEIRGTEKPEEIILFTAHYDSVPGSPGVIDNLGGTIALILLAEHLAKHPPARTARFLFCGSEERGLLGSKAHAEKRKKELDALLWVINIDILGDVLGREFCMTIGGDDALAFIEHLAREIGFPLKAEKNIYSSDSMPFARKGIPSFNIGSGGGGSHLCHTARDGLANFSAQAISESMELITALSDRLLCAKKFPLRKEIPEDIQKKVEEYFDERAGIKASQGPK
ncbi:MAG: M28 family metallopeptidase [candidate division WOR-3 bacterium]